MAKTQKKLPISVSHVNVRISISILTLRLIVIEIICSTFLVVFFYPLVYIDNLMDIQTVILSFHSIQFLIVVLIKFILTFYVVFQWVNEYYEILPTKIVHKQGFIFQREQEYNLQNIRSIGLKQGLVGRFFNVGSIDLFEWESRRRFTMQMIHNPLKYFHILESLLPNLDEEKTHIREHWAEPIREEL